jgi:ATP-binding cassette subfamily C (CFTR/MRP) protein 1
LAEVLDGITSIRSYALQPSATARARGYADDSARAYFNWAVANRWLGVRLEALGALTVLSTACLLVAARHRISPGLCGVALAYVATFTRSLSLAIRSSTALETQMAGVERLCEYANLTTEESQSSRVVETSATTTSSCTTTPSQLCNWPSAGAVAFHGVAARYAADLPKALCGVSLDLVAGTRCGIVGRSGSGKSSLMLALLRVLQCESGVITIDGVDISRVDTTTLRHAVGVIPQ